VEYNSNSDYVSKCQPYFVTGAGQRAQKNLQAKLEELEQATPLHMPANN